MARSLNEPGSPSAALTTTVDGQRRGAVGDDRPPLARRPGTRRRRGRCSPAASTRSMIDAGIDGAGVGERRHRRRRRRPAWDRRVGQDSGVKSRDMRRIPDTRHRNAIACNGIAARAIHHCLRSVRCPRDLPAGGVGGPGALAGGRRQEPLAGRRNRTTCAEHLRVGAHLGVAEARRSRRCARRGARRWCAARWRRRTATTTRRTGWDRGRAEAVVQPSSTDDVGTISRHGVEHVAAVGPHRALVHAGQRHPRVDVRGATEALDPVRATRSRPSSG